MAVEIPSPTSGPPVVIIILNWNNAPDTIECLESVTQLHYPDFQVIVVDNGSTDDSVARIRASCPDVDLIETGVNLGYAEGNNVGIRKALVTQPDFVCILNNDTVVARGFLSALVDAMRDDGRIGMAGPKTLYYDRPNLIYSAGCDIDWQKGNVAHRGMRETDSASNDLYLNHARQVNALTGCGVLVRRHALETVGLLDASYFLNFEDIDWCVRMTSLGYKIQYVPEAILYHKVSATLGQDSSANTYYMTRNSLHFFARFGPHKVRATAAILLRTLRSVAAWTIKPTYQTENFRSRRSASLHAIRDFAAGLTGPMPDSAS